MYAQIKLIFRRERPCLEEARVCAEKIKDTDKLAFEGEGDNAPLWLLHLITSASVSFTLKGKPFVNVDIHRRGDSRIARLEVQSELF